VDRGERRSRKLEHPCKSTDGKWYTNDVGALSLPGNQLDRARSHAFPSPLLAVSRTSRRQPQSIRGPGGRPTLNLQARPSAVQLAGGRGPLCAYCEMRAHPARCESGSPVPAAQHSTARWATTLGFRVPPSSVHLVRGRRPLRAEGEVRAHVAPVRSAPQRQVHFIRGPCERPVFGLYSVSRSQGDLAVSKPFATTRDLSDKRVSSQLSRRLPGGRI